MTYLQMTWHLEENRDNSESDSLEMTLLSCSLWTAFITALMIFFGIGFDIEGLRLGALVGLLTTIFTVSLAIIEGITK